MICISVFFVLSASLLIRGFVPNNCATNFSNIDSGICCPTPNGALSPCGHPSRGSCQQVLYSQTPNGRFMDEFRRDIRYQWPLRIFKYFCQCRIHFTGIDCGNCAPGYEGSECSQRRIKVRRNILSYSKEDLFVFRSVLNLSRHLMASTLALEETLGGYRECRNLVATSLHDSMVFIHQFTARPLLGDAKLCNDSMVLAEYANHNHNGPGFLTWHRYFMMEWEKIAAALARQYHNFDNFTFPYWDWTDRKHCEVCTNDMVGAPADKGDMLSCGSSFYNWTETCTEISGNPCLPCTFSNFNKRITRRWLKADFPTSKQIHYALSLPHYYPTTFKRNYVPLKGKLITIHRLLRPCFSFASFLEGDCLIGGELSMHNKVHNIVEGTFGLTRTAVNDPLFILHHIQIDRIFESWFRKYKEKVHQTFPRKVFAESHCYECFMVGFLPPVKHRDVFKSSIFLGYDYDSFVFGN